MIYILLFIKRQRKFFKLYIFDMILLGLYLFEDYKIKKSILSPFPICMQQNSQQFGPQFTEQLPILQSEGQNVEDQSPQQQQGYDEDQINGRQRKSSQIRQIKIKVQQCKKQEKSQKIAKQCRICLEGVEQGRMIKPCLCSGSITYAHQKCIMQWIKRKHEQRNTKIKPACEMCNTAFNYKYGKRRMLDMQQFCQNYKKQRCNFIMFYSLAIFLILVIIGLIVIITQSDRQTEIGVKIKNTLVKNQNVKIIYICVVFILAIVLMFLLILFTIEYAVKSEVVISEVMNYAETGIKKKTRIFPRVHNTRLRRDNSTSIF